MSALKSFYDAFTGRKNLSRKGKIIVIVVTGAFMITIIAAGQLAWGQGPCPDGSYPPPCGSCPGQEQEPVPPSLLPPPPLPEKYCVPAPALFGIENAYAQDQEEEEITVLEENDLPVFEDETGILTDEEEAEIGASLEGLDEALDEDLASDSGGDILPGDVDNFEAIPEGNEDLPPATESGAGLNDACLDSGFSQAQCSNYLFSDDPGGYCSTLTLAGVDCPEIQDPAFTYGNPEAAQQESEEDIANTERAIEGFNRAVPDNLGEGFADNPFIP